MTKCIIVFLSGIFFITTGCKRDVENIALPNTDIFLNDVAYGDDSLQKMDVYLPANRSAKTKIIVYLHGGSWTTGDKSDGEPAARIFQRKGYAFISMNYRLTRTAANNIHPAQVNDIAKALDFINGRYLKWNITGNRICLYGNSAGAHLSLLYAYKYNDPRVKAVVSTSGPVDLVDPKIANTTFKSLIESFMGCKLSENRDAWVAASPITYICENSVPTIFFQGKFDNLVPYSQVMNANNLLKKFGIKSKLILYQHSGHNLDEMTEDEFISEIEELVSTSYL